MGPVELVGGGGAAGSKLKFGTEKGKYPFGVHLGMLISFKQTTLSNGTKYYFVVVAYNNLGESKPSNEMEAVPGQ